MAMSAPARLEGVSLAVRLVVPDDAAYIHALRNDPAFNEYLSATSGTVDDQRRWIETYKEREARGAEYYYMIERIGGPRCGVVRLYDITPPPPATEGGTFTWGSWILDGNKPPKAALESACLVYSVAFDHLGLAYATFDVRRGNERTLAFHRRFGARETHADERDVFFAYSRESFAADREKHFSIIRHVGDAGQA